jgi:hypothetical protein
MLRPAKWHRRRYLPGVPGAARWLVTALVLAAAVTPAAAAEIAAEARLEIVARAIEYHGGDRYRHSEAELELCSGSGCYRIRVRTDGGLYAHEVSGPHRGRTRTVRADNDSVSVLRDGEPLAVLPEARQALRDWAMARIYFAFLPFRLEDPGVVHEDQGLEKWAGRRLHRVKVAFLAGSSTDAGDEFLYWFDPDTARLEQFAYSFDGRPGGLRFRRLSNYRRVGGILFFDQTNLGVEGDGLTVDEISAEFVEERMRPVSEVALREITVRPLEGGRR